MPSSGIRSWALFQRQDDRARDRIGEAETITEIFEHLAHCVEGRNHFRSRVRERIHVRPFADDAIAALSCLDHVDVPKAWPIGRDLPVRIEKILLAPGLDAKTNRIECRHFSTSS